MQRSAIMIFGEKSVVGPEKCYSTTDLYQYVEQLLKEAMQQERRCMNSSNYSWLKSRDLNDSPVEHFLEELRPTINKMSSESCAAIAVKLDKLTEERNYNTSDLLTHMKKLLEEEDSMQIMEKRIKRVKEKNVRINKVHPELSGRQATVSFIVESDML